ncbi:MAG: hypothetical protein ACFCBU_10120 [Cyanophyceae cyanobacterium]
MKDRVLGFVNTVLMLDFFFVVASLLWLVVAIVGQLNEFPLGLNWWYALWEPLFMPAIGVLMMGAIASGVFGWINRKFLTPKDL